jgi:O-antigen ligase
MISSIQGHAWQWITALWLLSLIYPSMADPAIRDILQAAAALWLLVVGALWKGTDFLFGPVFRYNRSILFATLALVGILSASALLSEDPLRSLGYVLVAALVLVASAGTWELTRGRLEAGLRVYAVAGTLIMTYFCWNAEEYSVSFGGRLSFSGHSHPNQLGLIAFSVLGASLAFANPYVRFALVGLNLFAIALAQARGALTASIVTLAASIAVAAWTDPRRRTRRALLIAGATGVLLVSVLVGYDWYTAGINQLFLLDSRERGWGSGFTGRLQAWDEALELFVSNPIFGVGFRLHERYMVSLSSAHNGYLSMLADTGLAGTAAAVLLLALLGRRVLRGAMSGGAMARVTVSFAAGYCVIAVFERFFLNSGNPTSVLFWVLLMQPAVAVSRPWVTASR